MCFYSSLPLPCLFASKHSESAVFVKTPKSAWLLSEVSSWVTWPPENGSCTDEGALTCRKSTRLMHIISFVHQRHWISVLTEHQQHKWKWQKTIMFWVFLLCGEKTQIKKLRAFVKLCWAGILSPEIKVRVRSKAFKKWQKATKQFNFGNSWDKGIVFICMIQVHCEMEKF